MIEVETEGYRLNRMEFPLLEEIIASSEFEDADFEIDPLLTVKREDDSTTDCVIDVESFPQDIMDGLTDSLFQATNAPASSFQGLDSGTEEITETDVEDDHRYLFCGEKFMRKLTSEFRLKQREDKKKTNCDKCNGTFLCRNEWIVHQIQAHGNLLPKNSERKVVIKFTRIDLSSNGQKPGVKHDKNHFFAVIEKGNPPSQQFSKRQIGDERPFKCDVDVYNEIFPSADSVTIHKRFDVGERPHKCDTCNRTFAMSEYLNVHKIIHTDKRPYKCEVCNWTFARSNTLAQHQTIHTGERSYKCDFCTKTFARSTYLTIHKRIHTGERPFKCDLCNKTFHRTKNLTIHKRTHTLDRQYKCEVCLKGYSHASSLRAHNKREHTLTNKAAMLVGIYRNHEN